MKKILKTLALVALTVAGVKAVERVNNNKKNMSKLTTTIKISDLDEYKQSKEKIDDIQTELKFNPRLSDIVRLENRIDELEKQNVDNYSVKILQAQIDAIKRKIQNI